nr:putative serine/threonine-protein kinase isoform X1 [Ipomoea batatas]
MQFLSIGIGTDFSANGGNPRPVPVPGLVSPRKRETSHGLVSLKLRESSPGLDSRKFRNQPPGFQESQGWFQTSPWDWFLGLVCAICMGSAPVVHRNFKTAMWLVDENFIAKVADAGISRLLKEINHDAARPFSLDPVAIGSSANDFVMVLYYGQ